MGLTTSRVTVPREHNEICCSDYRFLKDDLFYSADNIGGTVSGVKRGRSNFENMNSTIKIIHWIVRTASSAASEIALS